MHCSWPGDAPQGTSRLLRPVPCAVLSQVLIVPQEHVMAMTDADEAAEPVPGFDTSHFSSLCRLHGQCA